jgi:hypothetical protein
MLGSALGSKDGDSLGSTLGRPLGIAVGSQFATKQAQNRCAGGYTYLVSQSPDKREIEVG